MNFSSQQQKRANELEAEQNRAQNREYHAFLQGPEYQAALKQDGENRETAFYDLPETVCGFELKPLTALGLLALHHIQSPFLIQQFIRGKRKPVDSLPFDAGDEWLNAHVLIHPREIPRFLWPLSVDFVPMAGSRWRKFLARMAHRRFVRRCRKLSYGKSCEEIRHYLDDSLCDRPGGAGVGIPIASWISGDVHFLAKEYGWTEREILNTPLKRIYQYQRRIVEASGNKAAISNRSDSLKAEWLARLNERLAEQRKAQQ